MELLKKIRVKDIMATNVVTVSEEDPLSAAIDKFIVHGISYVCIKDDDGRLVGLVSQKYIYKTKSPFKIVDGQNIYDKNIIIDGDSYFDKDQIDAIPLRTMMKRDPFTLEPDDKVSKAIMNMAVKNIGCIPVVDAFKKPVGIITNQDIVNMVAVLLGEQ